MAYCMWSFSYTHPKAVGSISLTVSPHRAGLEIAEARALIEGLNLSDVESEELVVFYSFTEVAESLIAPGLYVPDPISGTPLASVSEQGEVPEGFRQELLRRWEEAYEKATLHQPL